MAVEKVNKSEAEWRRELTAEQYRVAREQGTEPAFTGEYWDCKSPGVYHCVGCGAALFDSETKYESGTGWPSYTGPVAGEPVELREDDSHGMRRTEVVCARCGSHLGHRFPDGPGPGGWRYCLNSAGLKLQPR
ncbi:MAG: peptide-methionine (R)-S-oxide reductase MsrB [Terriglobales bacterium]